MHFYAFLWGRERSSLLPKRDYDRKRSSLLPKGDYDRKRGETPKQKYARLQENVVDLRENLIKHISDIYVKIGNNYARQDALAGKESYHT